MLRSQAIVLLAILLLLSLMVWSRVNAQEEVPIDIPIEQVIVTEPEPPLVTGEESASLVSDTPPTDTGGVVVSDIPIDVTLDDKRLEIMAFQSLSFESTGEYTQVKDMRVVEGDVIGFEASMVDVVESTEEIHVYDAPCGQGWQLIVYDTDYGYITSSSTGKTEYQPYPITRSYGYGCEHTARTFNW